MTRLFNDPATFMEDMLAGFLDANSRYVVGVPGGVVRAAPVPEGKVAVVVGGGSGHYPAFAASVGPGFADGAVVGNIFTSPSADDAVPRRAGPRTAGGGVSSPRQLRRRRPELHRWPPSGCAARASMREYVAVTDDVASAPATRITKRRGIAGDFAVFKVRRRAPPRRATTWTRSCGSREHANDRTRTLGVAFGGCTMPGAEHPLFTVPDGQMGVGLGIHGEPGVAEDDHAAGGRPRRASWSTACSPNCPQALATRVAVPSSTGSARTKYEELFVVWGTASRHCCASAGSRSSTRRSASWSPASTWRGARSRWSWLDEELERFWRAPADTPAYRKGSVGTDRDRSPRRSAWRRRPPERGARSPRPRHLGRRAVTVVAAFDRHGGDARRRRGRTRPDRRGRR